MKKTETLVSHMISCSLIWKKGLFSTHIFQYQIQNIFVSPPTLLFLFFWGSWRSSQKADHGLRIFVLKSFFSFKITNCVTVLKFFCLFEKLSGSSMLMEGVARNFKLDFGFDQMKKKLAKRCARWLDIFRDFDAIFWTSFSYNLGGIFSWNQY